MCAERSFFRLFDKHNLNAYQLSLEVTISITTPAKWNLCLNLITGNSQARKYIKVGQFKVFLRRYHIQSENKASLYSCSTHSYKIHTMHPLTCCTFSLTYFLFGSQNFIFCLFDSQTCAWYHTAGEDTLTHDFPRIHGGVTGASTINSTLFPLGCGMHHLSTTIVGILLKCLFAFIWSNPIEF